MASASQISFRNLGRQSWASALTPRGGTRDGTPGRRALRVVAESRRDCPGQRRTAERLRRGREGWVGIGAEIIPKVSSNAGQSLSQPAADSSLYTREPCPAGDGGSGRRVVGPYGKPKPAGAQRSVRARGREGWAGIGARTIPKGGPPPRPLRQRLAKRKARKEQLVKFDFCPTTSECSTAHNVRKSQQSPARAPVGITLTEQHSLEPRPSARQGASRARNCAAIKRFFF